MLTVPDLLRANAPAPEAAFVFFPHDSGSRWEAECTELQEKHLAKLEEAFQKPQVVEFDLIHDSAGPFVDDVVDELLRSETRWLLIDITTMPKSLLLPLVARVLTEEHFTEVVATYTEVRAYTAVQLQSEPTQPEAVPPFDRIGLSTLTEVAWVPILGFNPDVATEIYSSFVDSFSLADRIFPVLGLPAIDLSFHERAFLDGTRGFQDTLIGGLTHEQLKYASATDPFHTCDVIRSLANELTPVHCIGSPLGPKPMTLGMVLAALDHDITVVIAQSRSYHPEYSVGEGESYVYPLVQGGAHLYR